jgi:hypothetical protein
MQGRVVSTRTGEQLITFSGSRYSVNVMPALTPQDILINSVESLLQLRDVVLSRSEEEVCRELVLRIPVSENLRLQIARQALEMSERDESPTIPASMTPLPEEPARVDYRRAGQPVNSIQVRAAVP